MAVKKIVSVKYIDDDGFEFTHEPVDGSLTIVENEEGYEARYLVRDELAEDPRENSEPLGTMVCNHSRYALGDKEYRDKYKSVNEFMTDLAMMVDPSVEGRIDYWENGNGWRKLVKQLGESKACDAADEKIKALVVKAIKDKVLLAPLYLYDHSGITMRMGHGFGDIDPQRWDWGHVGYIYITHERIKQEMSRKRGKKYLPIKHLSKKDLSRAWRALEGEVKEYDAYLTGDVYGLVKETYDKEKEQINEDSVWGYYQYDYAIEALKTEL